MSTRSHNNTSRRTESRRAESHRTERTHRLLGIVAGAVLCLNALHAGAAASVPKNAHERAAMLAYLKAAIDKSSSFADRYDAQVWLFGMSTRLAPFVPNPKKRFAMLRAIHREARRAHLKPDLVLAVIQVESRFNRFAISRAGAQGLMQVMPFWKNRIGRPDDNLTNIDTNLRYGCRILEYYMREEHGNWAQALARYNGSYGKMWYPALVMDAWRDRWYSGAL